ncbi:MAG: Uma2 family endonuclease [Planctomycetota bacterium]|jgi:Uma2 family endonuclease
MSAEITTADQLLKAQHLGRCELVRGEFRQLIPPSFEHGRVTMRLGRRLANHVEPRGAGIVVAGDPGFWLERDPDTVRAPDIAFVAAHRPAGPKRGYYEGPPDLAVEVLSPDDRPGAVREKVAEWLEAGTREVWVVDPINRTVTINGARTLHEDDVLTSALLPGLELAVREIF